MNRYIKDKTVINATEKAYNTLYKEQGYVPYKEETKTVKNTKKKEEADKQLASFEVLTMSDNVNKVKEILNITDSKLDNYLAFCEKNITDKILDRCNIEIIPERLNSLIQEFLIEQYNLNKEGIGKGKKEVSSASDNGQSVAFKTIGGANAMSQNVDEFLNRNMATLVTYRKIRW